MTIPASSDPETAAWLAQLIGKPWLPGGTGPQGYDCWGLVAEVQFRLWGRDLHEAAIGIDAARPRDVIEAIRASALQRRWLSVDRPRPGDLVLMKRRSDPVHVGVWISPAEGVEGAMHAVRDVGVMFQSLAQLRAGWGGVEFRRFAGDALDALPSPATQLAQFDDGDAAVVVVVCDPLDPLRDARVTSIEPGQTPAQALASIGGTPAACWLCLDATPLLRRHPQGGTDEWTSTVIEPGQILWVMPPLPEGDDGSQVLAVVATVAVAIAAPYAVGALGLAAGSLAGKLAIAGITMGANLLVSAFMPQTNPVSASIPDPSPTYTLGAPQNALRPGGVVPVTYGTMRRVPELLTQPWGAYAGNEHFLYLLLCVGAGRHRVNAFGIEDTPVWESGAGYSGAIDDIEHEIVLPGNPVTLFPVNVRVSEEVGGQELPEPDGGSIRIGNFIAVPSGETSQQLVVDFQFPRGLFDLTASGRASKASVTWRVDVREVDASGKNIGPWTAAANYTLEVASTTPLRLTRNIQLPSLGRWKVRAQRMTASTLTHANGQDQIIWSGLRAIVSGSRVFEDVTALALKIRATETSSRGAFLWYVDSTRSLRRWNSSAQKWAWGPTEHIEAAALDVMTADYGLGLDDARVDWPALQTLAEIWAGRDDVCCMTVDTPQSAWDVLEAVLTTGRARPQFVGNTVTVIRDQPRGLPAQLITHADMVRGSFRVDRLHHRRDAPNVVTVNYRDRQGNLQSVTAQPAGVTNPRPATVEGRGFVDHRKAWEHGIYLAASNNLRRRYVSFTMLAAGRALVRGDLIAIAHPRPAYGTPARIVSRSGLELVQSEPHDLNAGTAHFMAIQRPDGSYWGPVRVRQAAGGDPNTLEMDSDDLASLVTDPTQSVGYGGDPRNWMVTEADLSPVTESSTELLDGRQSEATRVAVGPLSAETLQCLVVEMTPRSDGTVEVFAVEEHPGVHTAEDGLVAPQPVISQDTLFPAGPAWVGATAIVRTIGGDVSILITGPSVPAARRYMAQLSVDGGTSWAQTVLAVEPRLSLDAPEESVVDVRFRAIGMIGGPWGYARIDGQMAVESNAPAFGDFGTDFSTDFGGGLAPATNGDFAADFGSDFGI